MPRFICERCRRTADTAGRCDHCGYHEVLDASAPDTELWLEVNDAMTASVAERIGGFLHESAGVIGFALLFAVPAAFYAFAPAAIPGRMAVDLCLMPGVLLVTYLLLDPLATFVRWFSPSPDEVGEPETTPPARQYTKGTASIVERIRDNRSQARRSVSEREPSSSTSDRTGG